MSAGEDTLQHDLQVAKIPFVREYRFAPPRRWRFDFLLEEMLAIEVEGGTFYGKSRHTTGKGFEEDCVKYLEATKLGYRVIRFTTRQVTSGFAIIQIKDLLGMKD